MSIKTFLIGRPIDTVHEKHERVSKTLGLAVFSSDALSSVAYATEEMLLPLSLLGLAALHFAMPVGAAIVALIVIVAVSYTQTIKAYPSGGGAYLVARENIGDNAGLVAGAALMVDYVLTVTVSISAGVAAITSAFPALHTHSVALCLVSLFVITVVNLRGIRETGSVFAVPTYIFIFGVGALVLYGLFSYFTGPDPHPVRDYAKGEFGVLPYLIILKAFSSGCTALTGIEAVANGVAAFRQPETRNASITLAWMAGILGFFFIGITYLVYVHGIYPKEHETVLSQLAVRVFGSGGMYYLIQFATFAILILAANTSFAGFPRLSSIMAHDSYLPRQLMSLGDRLVYSNGILLLSVTGGALIIMFGGETHAMIPLYTVGVFIAFTLSQAGMVGHWIKYKESGWMTGVALNGLGAVLTGVVLIVVGSSKFMQGAWLVAAALPMIIFFMWRIKQHYLSIEKQFDPATQIVMEEGETRQYQHHSVIIPVSGIQQPVINAIKYAKAISEDVTALYVCLDTQTASITKEKWAQYGMGVPLLVIDSPYRSVIEPLIDYIEEIRKVYKDGVITVVLPEFVPSLWWHHLLHNQTALLIKGILLFKRGVVSTSVPFHLK